MRHQTAKPNRARSSWARSRAPLDRPVDSSVRALVWIDMEPILEIERLRCEKALQNLEAVKEKLKVFRSQTEQAYSRWFHSLFGEQVTRVRELQMKASELEELIVNVRTESAIMGCSEKTAYQRLMKMRNHRERIEEKLKKKRETSSDAHSSESSHSDSGFNSNPIGESSDDDVSPDVAEFLRMSLDSILGDRSDYSQEQYAEMLESLKQQFRENISGQSKKKHHTENEDFSHRQKEFPKPKAKPQDPEESRLKQIYRTLARQLHPDINLTLSLQDKELWYEVQAAYESKSLDQLETLAAIAEGGTTSGFSKIRSVSQLQMASLELERKLKSSQKALRQAKKQPAWNFLEIQAHPAQLRELTTRIDRDLAEAMDALEKDIEEFEQRIERWKKTSPPARRRSSRGSGF